MSRSQCPPELRAEFLGEPAAVVLQAGERLYKFVSVPFVRERILQSPWWIRQQTFDLMQARARALGRPLEDLIRAHLAIKREWNPGIDAMWVVVLASPVSAWAGRARSQPISKTGGNVALMGGGDQVCVPALDWRQIQTDYSAQWAR